MPRTDVPKAAAPGPSMGPGARSLVGAAIGLLLAAGLPAQHWRELQGHSRSGLVELHQAVRDAGSDALVLLIASHPDDRYVLPAAVLRHRHGARVSVLLMTRGGGGQNSRGPETGDALERIRTLEAEAGCSLMQADVWHLNRPDGGYRRTAEETFGEWGRLGTIRDLARLIRTIRPDVVLTTHHREENHGHDLAVVEILPEAVAQAANPDYAAGGLPPHLVQRLFLGASSSPTPAAVRLWFDEIEPVRGVTFRRLAYEVIARTHASTGPLLPMERLYEPEMWFEPTAIGDLPQGPVSGLLDGVRDLFDGGLWPSQAAESAAGLRSALETELPAALLDPGLLVTRALESIGRLQALPARSGSEFDRRRNRRLEALDRVLRLACSIRVEVEAEPGAVAVPGEVLRLGVRVHNGPVREIRSLRVDAMGGGTVELEVVPRQASTRVPVRGALRAELAYYVPLGTSGHEDPRAGAFRGDRFVPPVRLRFLLDIEGREVPVRIDVPVELRPPVEIEVVPPMLLLPMARKSVEFTVTVQRNSRFPVRFDRATGPQGSRLLEVLAPTGYVVEGSRREVRLVESRGDTFDFELRAPDVRKGGVDVLRIRLGDQRIALPVHKIDVTIDRGLRIGVVRGNDDALPSVIGIGGLGLRWSELTDADLAVRDLGEFDAIVVDFRALRDRPSARRSFRRLLDFCARAGKRLVVFYHKDTEYDPPGEGFVGAPFLPFQVGRSRVTRPDAPVRVLRPGHVLLQSPNPLLASDWDAWEQERGLYFPSVHAPEYEELLEMADPGQAPERGALLYARTGEGEFVYCALALYRQLKKLHPGGVRLLANLLTPMRR